MVDLQLQNLFWMSDTTTHDWITFHRMRFPERISAIELVFTTVDGPNCWLFGPNYDVAPDGMFTGVSDIWCGVGIWHSQAAAEAMIVSPGDGMPWLDETVASWRCLGIPISYHGEVNWRGYVQKGDAAYASHLLIRTDHY